MGCREDGSREGKGDRFAILLAEAAVELVPRELWTHPAVRSWCRRFGRSPEEAILDASYHWRAMVRLKNKERRGRPDILHYSLLSILEMPLAKAGMLDIYFSTQDGRVFYVESGTRLPRAYTRWIGLLSQLLREGNTPRIYEVGDIETFLKRFRHRFLLHEHGEKRSITVEKGALYIVGAFQHGDFFYNYFEDAKISIYEESLPTWVVATEVVASIERQIGLVP